MFRYISWKARRRHYNCSKSQDIIPDIYMYSEEYRRSIGALYLSKELRRQRQRRRIDEKRQGHKGSRRISRPIRRLRLPQDDIDSQHSAVQSLVSCSSSSADPHFVSSSSLPLVFPSPSLYGTPTRSLLHQPTFIGGHAECQWMRKCETKPMWHRHFYSYEPGREFFSLDLILFCLKSSLLFLLLFLG